MKKYIEPEMEIDFFEDNGGLFGEASVCNGCTGIDEDSGTWFSIGEKVGDAFNECLNDSPYERK